MEKTPKRGLFCCRRADDFLHNFCIKKARVVKLRHMDQAQKIELPKGKLVGKITHFFPKISVAVILLSADLKVGDEIVVAAHGGDFEQPVDSMQIERQDIGQAKAGQDVGLKVAAAVKEGDAVYLKG